MMIRIEERPGTRHGERGITALLVTTLVWSISASSVAIGQVPCGEQTTNEPCYWDDADDDNDGIPDILDPLPLDPRVCGDLDLDGCDDCSFPTDGFGPAPDSNPDNDGPDSDGDGLCDPGDPCVADPWNDADLDGFCFSDGDCDDDDALTNPGADELCDALDNDCDTLVDEGGSCGRSCPETVSILSWDTGFPARTDEGLCIQGYMDDCLFLSFTFGEAVHCVNRVASKWMDGFRIHPTALCAGNPPNPGNGKGDQRDPFAIPESELPLFCMERDPRWPPRVAQPRNDGCLCSVRSIAAPATGVGTIEVTDGIITGFEFFPEVEVGAHAPDEQLYYLMTWIRIPAFTYYLHGQEVLRRSPNGDLILDSKITWFLGGTEPAGEHLVDIGWRRVLRHCEDQVLDFTIPKYRGFLDDALLLEDLERKLISDLTAWRAREPAIVVHAGKEYLVGGPAKVEISADLPLEIAFVASCRPNQDTLEAEYLLNGTGSAPGRRPIELSPL